MEGIDQPGGGGPRATLTQAERAVFTKRRKEAYEALHPGTVHGAAGNGREKRRQLGDSSSAARFTADTARRTGSLRA